MRTARIAPAGTPAVAAGRRVALALPHRRRRRSHPVPLPLPALRRRPTAAAAELGAACDSPRPTQQQQQQQQQGRLAALAVRLLQPGVLGAVAVCGLAALLLPAAAHAAATAAAGGGAASGASNGLVGLAKQALSFVLHLDVHLGEIVAKYGATTYAILFAIVFAETGLVVTPFLPGDSLLFATGALAAMGKLSLPALAGCYIVAATLGDAVNYAVGNYLGAAAFKSSLLKKEHVAKTEQFYAQYGGKTVVLARFVPIVRTFAPFVAGVGSMPYREFGLYNVAGAVLWTAVCVGAGFAFGNVPAVHDNFSLVVLGIVAVSLLPIAWEVWAARRAAAAAPEPAQPVTPAQVPHSTPRWASEAVEFGGMPPRASPAADAAAAEAVAIAREKMVDPLEEQRDRFCDDNPGSDECKVFD